MSNQDSEFPGTFEADDPIPVVKAARGSVKNPTRAQLRARKAATQSTSVTAMIAVGSVIGVVLIGGILLFVLFPGSARASIGLSIVVGCVILGAGLLRFRSRRR